MKIVKYSNGSETAVGVKAEGGVLPTGFSDMRELISAGPDTLAELAERLDRAEPGELLTPDRFLAPVPNGCQLLFAGGNYRDHLAETGLRPKEPVFFAKLPSAIIGPDEPIRIPSPETHCDWEAELAFLISKPAYKVPAERAYEYIFGFTMVNDVSAREVMDREPLQITLCKCPDTFCPIGPHVTTTDELPVINEAPLEISTRVNGVIKQQTTTDQMIYSIPVLLEFLTRTVTLRPGDLVTSGTPGGTGLGRHPQEFMHPGDHVTVGVTGVGYLSNPLARGWSEEAQSSGAATTASSVHDEQGVPSR